ncbi:MAG: tRNA threonylcarbamoyladenosine dehydratase [Tissierellia bacterium]|nr:tRNA threonylcarbamoyladenosine dehydratase [Tissierellia bacterium]
MTDWKLRTRMLLGDRAVEALEKKRGIVFGLGGVGGQACEALARAGIGSLDLVDKDIIDSTNINRQIIALPETVGRPKVEVMRERLEAINPQIGGDNYKVCFSQELEEKFSFASYDFIIDAIDDVEGKLLLAKMSQQDRVLFISSMGSANKLDPSQLEITSLYKTTVCPLARAMRKGARDLGLEDYPVVYSKEKPTRSEDYQPGPLASSSFVPPAAGLMMVSYVVRSLVAMEGLIK